MSERKLNPEQIDYLFTFVEQRGVKYYDVQMELVDHLACEIEQKWHDQPHLSFDEALGELRRYYTKWDFENIVEEKEGALRRKYMGLQWRYVREYFKLPKIILSVAVCGTLFTIFNSYAKYKWVVFILLVVHSLCIFLYSGVIYPLRHKIRPQQGKDFLIVDSVDQIRRRIFSYLFLPFYFFWASTWLRVQFDIYVHFSDFDGIWFKMAWAALITFLFIFWIGYIAVFKRIKADFIHQYPQFVKA